MDNNKNISDDVVKGFGDEWTRFDQTDLASEEAIKIFNDYFSIFPWEMINNKSEGFDLGCGSGRWAYIMAPRVGHLNCIDASIDAINITAKVLSEYDNCSIYTASVDSMPLNNESQDFGYSLGVLHHIPDILSALEDCAKKLKPGAPFLIYCYYAFDNRPYWFRLIWRISDIARNIISRTPLSIRYIISQVIAALIYYPLAKSALLLEKLNFDVSGFPLSYYKDHSFYVMRTDSLDRFGTRLEKRFTRKQLKDLMCKAGFENIVISSTRPYWCVLGYRSSKTVSHE